jgi:transposase
MLTRELRTAILELQIRGVSRRRIARTLKISRKAVGRVIGEGTADPPALERPEKAEPHRKQILELWATCRGNLVRVHEELEADGVVLAYPTLTAFCRREKIGQEPVVPSGRYHFAPGQETQHDTSPHHVVIGGKEHPVQTASAVLCYAHALFFQCYPNFTRFECKVFLTDTFVYFHGATKIVMIDNTHVVVLRGTGADMVPVPEMVAFAERYGFTFEAHEKGDANRSARVERPFGFIERNFFPGRVFKDWNDLNTQARTWCDKMNRKYKKHIRAVPWELYAAERNALQPLPLWVPDVYRLHQRVVDVEGYVSVHSNHYSVPPSWVGRPVQVRETNATLEIDDDQRGHVRHQRLIGVVAQRVTLPEHRVVRGQGQKRAQPGPEEAVIIQTCPELGDYVAAFKKSGRKQTTLALRQLLRMTREYPRPALLAAFSEAGHYGLYDLDRVERMVLRRIAADYFLLDPRKDDDDER